ncbi:hypothetical protein G6F52_009440 [Rhizopus delemar]|nr:hypothetical protein G6F54_011243 [Rhizopus delemar]KAG1516462.1 hypothetical protein G6F52_009440 [Rhizopus delemar]
MCCYEDVMFSQKTTDIHIPTGTFELASLRSTLTPFTIHDLISASSRSPRKSSPGIDGIPYEILSLVFKHPGVAPLAVKVYNKALLQSVFPPSWLCTSTALLPKKGDLTLLKNWRPISLINTDAKIFTRLLNSRLISVFSHRISPCQMGFMPKRFIGEHGRLLHLVMTSTSIRKSSAVGLLLDKEKAYDRVHPTYLSQVMIRFGVPPPLVTTIIGLFFSTNISININGFLTTSFVAQRGLRQEAFHSANCKTLVTSTTAPDPHRMTPALHLLLRYLLMPMMY